MMIFCYCGVAVDHVHAAGLTDVASRRKVAVAVARNTGTAARAGAGHATATVATARRVARAARASTEVARAVATANAVVPAVETVTARTAATATTTTTHSRKPTTTRIVNRTTEKRPSHLDRQATMTTTTAASVKAVPRPVMTGRAMVLRAHLPNALAVPAVAGPQTRIRSKVGSCSHGVVP